MRIDVLTLFPKMFDSPLSLSILKRAQDSDIVDIALTDIRDFADNSYNKVDDKPYGGGPGMVIIDAVVRLLEGALGDEDSAKDDSFSNSLLEYPQYTRPELFRDMKVPDVLLSGNHAEIEKWRKQQAIKKTKTHRQDLIKD
jgi:tRNA (guanine37-N1)-methyltransferase